MGMICGVAATIDLGLLLDVKKDHTLILTDEILPENKIFGLLLRIWLCCVDYRDI